MDMFPIRLEVPSKVTESLEYIVLNRNTGKIIEEYVIENDAISNWGFEQIVRLTGNVGTGYPINRVRVKRDASWVSTVVTANSESNGTLTLGAGTFNTAGTYNAFRCSNDTQTGDESYHNNLDCTIVVGIGQELVVTIKFAFSGLDGDGNRMCACLLGTTGSYQYPVTHFETNWDDDVNTTNSLIGSTTLRCDSYPNSFSPQLHTFFMMRDAMEDIFASFPATVNVGANQILYAQADFVFSQG